jgi:hypothetical protein
VIDHVYPETLATIVSLLNTYLCHALHLFDEMPDRPSSCLFLVGAMPHAPPPQLAVACRLSPWPRSSERLWPSHCLISGHCCHATRASLLLSTSLFPHYRT